MAELQYIDPILKKYAALIQSKTTKFKRFYFGEPIRIGTSELPVIILSKIDTKANNETNVEDRHQIRISLTVVTDVRTTISDDKEMVRGINSLYNLVEGRDDTTLKLLPESLLGILRHDVEFDVGNNLRTDLNSSTDVSYGMAMGKRAEESWSIEGVVTFVATFIQVR